MKFRGEVMVLESLGDEAAVTIGNVWRVCGADWRPYQKSLIFNMPIKSASAFPIGRLVDIEITPRRKP